MQKYFMIFSYFLFLIPFIFITTFFFDFIIIEKIQGLPIFSPLVFCSTGLFLAVKAYQIQKNTLAIGAIIVNLLLFLFPIVYIIGGTVIFGV